MLAVMTKASAIHKRIANGTANQPPGDRAPFEALAGSELEVFDAVIVVRL